MFVGIYLILWLSIVLNIRCKEHPEAKLPFMDYCRFFGYPSQYYDVTTHDGYILRIFRIQKKGTTIKSGLEPIFLQHGLLDSSDTWLINEEGKAPGFMLANAGYDVWLGNSRGNKHSRKHVRYNPDKDAEFWEFTFQHMADYDVPAVLEYVYNATGQKVSYVGHSQGSVQMHIALAKNNPVVQKVLHKYFAFGPIAYIAHQNSYLIGLLDKSPILRWFQLLRIHQFLPSLTWFETDLGVLFCADFPHVCGELLKYICDADPELDNYQRYDVLVGHDPSGTSVMNMAHWKQLLDNKGFQAYDYGSISKNIDKYGQITPPKWDLSKITQPIRLFVGDSDQLADQVDVNHFWQLLDPSVQAFKKVYMAGHATFLWGKDVDPWMQDLFKLLKDQEKQQGVDIPTNFLLSQ